MDKNIPDCPAASVPVYYITFHTHVGALVSTRNLTAAGCSARMMPVPRKLSSSCGTCVRAEGAVPEPALLDADWDGVYVEEAPGRYRTVLRNET